MLRVCDPAILCQQNSCHLDISYDSNIPIKFEYISRKWVKFAEDSISLRSPLPREMDSAKTRKSNALAIDT